MKKTLKKQDLDNISSSLKEMGGQKRVIDQINAWRAENMSSTSSGSPAQFGISEFGQQIRMERHIDIAIASQNGSCCMLCLEILESTQRADVSTSGIVSI